MVGNVNQSKCSFKQLLLNFFESHLEIGELSKDKKHELQLGATFSVGSNTCVITVRVRTYTETSLLNVINKLFIQIPYPYLIYIKNQK